MEEEEENNKWRRASHAACPFHDDVAVDRAAAGIGIGGAECRDLTIRTRAGAPLSGSWEGRLGRDAADGGGGGGGGGGAPTSKREHEPARHRRWGRSNGGYDWP